MSTSSHFALSGSDFARVLGTLDVRRCTDSLQEIQVLQKSLKILPSAKVDEAITRGISGTSWIRWPRPMTIPGTEVAAIAEATAARLGWILARIRRNIFSMHTFASG